MYCNWYQLPQPPTGSLAGSPADRHSGLSPRSGSRAGSTVMVGAGRGVILVQAKVFVHFPVGYGLVVAFPFVYLVLHE